MCEQYGHLGGGGFDGQLDQEEVIDGLCGYKKEAGTRRKQTSGSTLEGLSAP